MLELHKSVGLRGIILSPTFDLASQISRLYIYSTSLKYKKNDGNIVYLKYLLLILFFLNRELIFLNHRIPNHIEVKLLNKLNLNPVVFKEQIQSVDLLVNF